MSDKNYKFVVIEATATETQDIFRYMEADEDVCGFICFDTFAEAKQFYLECLQKKVDKALKLKAKDVE